MAFSTLFASTGAHFAQRTSRLQPKQAIITAKTFVRTFKNRDPKTLYGMPYPQTNQNPMEVFPDYKPGDKLEQRIRETTYVGEKKKLVKALELRQSRRERKGETKARIARANWAIKRFLKHNASNGPQADKHQHSNRRKPPVKDELEQSLGSMRGILKKFSRHLPRTFPERGRLTEHQHKLLLKRMSQLPVGGFGDKLRKRIEEAETPKQRARLEEVLEMRIAKKKKAEGYSFPQIMAQVFGVPNWSLGSLLPSASPSPSSASNSDTLQSASPSSPTETSDGSSTPTPTTTQPTPEEEITPATLHHLLRLSALPPPASSAEQDSMLATLRTQLHFVRDIQTVDTTNVTPLSHIRNETTTIRDYKEIQTRRAIARMRNEEVEFGFLKRRQRKPAAVVSSVRIPFAHKEPTPRPGEIVSKSPVSVQDYENEEASVKLATRTRRERGYFVVETVKRKGECESG